MKYYLCALGMVMPLAAVRPSTTSVVRHNQRVASFYEKNLEPAFVYFLGKPGPRFSQDICPHLRKKIEASHLSDDELYELIKSLDVRHIKLSESQELDMKLKELRRLIHESVEEVLTQKEDERAESKIELVMAQKVLKTERYKYYAALAGLAGMSLTAAVSLATLLVQNM